MMGLLLMLHDAGGMAKLLRFCRANCGSGCIIDSSQSPESLSLEALYASNGFA